MGLMQSEAITVRKIKGKGRGVFARRLIADGEIIERVPVIVVPAEQIRDAHGQDDLLRYVYEWGQGTVALALGYGSLYNHSYEPNARYEDLDGRTKLFVALREIGAGEEITINYNGEPDDRSPVWFDVVDRSYSDRSRRAGPRRGENPTSPSIGTVVQI
jgi:SET domain-containing protein